MKIRIQLSDTDVKNVLGDNVSVHLIHEIKSAILLQIEDGIWEEKVNDTIQDLAQDIPELEDGQYYDN